MFGCFRRDKTKSSDNDVKKRKKISPVSSSEIATTQDTEDDLSVDEMIFTQDCSQLDLSIGNVGKVCVDRILNQRTCRQCKYGAYYVTFHTVVILQSNFSEFSKLHSITESIEFESGGCEYVRVKCAPRWLLEMDLLYVSFPTDRKYTFVLLDIANSFYEMNSSVCDCLRELRNDPFRWSYYKAIEIK